MIEYVNSVEGITADQLGGFFVGWPNPPNPEVHLQLLQNSDEVVLAMDTASGRVVGFIMAITDQTLAAYIPLNKRYLISPYSDRFNDETKKGDSNVKH